MRDNQIRRRRLREGRTTDPAGLKANIDYYEAQLIQRHEAMVREETERRMERRVGLWRNSYSCSGCQHLWKAKAGYYAAAECPECSTNTLPYCSD